MVFNIIYQQCMYMSCHISIRILFIEMVEVDYNFATAAGRSNNCITVVLNTVDKHRCTGVVSSFYISISLLKFILKQCSKMI